MSTVPTLTIRKSIRDEGAGITATLTTEAINIEMTVDNYLIALSKALDIPIFSADSVLKRLRAANTVVQTAAKQHAAKLL